MAMRDDGAMHILIVEDDVKLGRLLLRVLHEEGHVVEWVEDGDEAAARLAEDSYDLAVLDVMLPGVDGFELARQVRERALRLPILMLTARGAVADRVRGLDAGADDYLVKPFVMAEFLARVRALSRRPPVVPGESLRVGPIEMDTRTRVVQVAGSVMELTAKEYALLELFLRHPGAVLSRAQILDRVWSFDYDGQSNVVETYIRYLRKKLGPAREMLQTVRGMGYRLDSSS